MYFFEHFQGLLALIYPRVTHTNISTLSCGDISRKSFGHIRYVFSFNLTLVLSYGKFKIVQFGGMIGSKYVH